MRVYCEAVETVAEEEGEFARIDVTDYTKAEREQILAALKDLMPGCAYTERRCFHDEGKPCNSVVI